MNIDNNLYKKAYSFSTDKLTRILFSILKTTRINTNMLTDK